MGRLRIGILTFTALTAACTAPPQPDLLRQEVEPRDYVIQVTMPIGESWGGPNVNCAVSRDPCPKEIVLWWRSPCVAMIELKATEVSPGSAMLTVKGSGRPPPPPPVDPKSSDSKRLRSVPPVFTATLSNPQVDRSLLDAGLNVALANVPRAKQCLAVHVDQQMTLDNVVAIHRAAVATGAAAVELQMEEALPASATVLKPTPKKVQTD